MSLDRGTRLTRGKNGLLAIGEAIAGCGRKSKHNSNKGETPFFSSEPLGKGAGIGSSSKGAVVFDKKKTRFREKRLWPSGPSRRDFLPSTQWKRVGCSYMGETVRGLLLKEFPSAGSKKKSSVVSPSCGEKKET